MDDLQKQFPLNAMLNHYWLPVIRAYVELRGNHPDRAIKLLEEAAPYDLASPWPEYTESGQMHPPYVRGQAYLALHQGKEAATEFQKFATLGQNEKALHWLEMAYRQRAEWLVLLNVDPCFDDLRPDPRFQALMRRMNFPH